MILLSLRLQHKVVIKCGVKNLEFCIFCTQTYNLAQKIVDKFTKLSKICFSMECFSDTFSVFRLDVKICLLGERLGTHREIQAFEGFS